MKLAINDRAHCIKGDNDSFKYIEDGYHLVTIGKYTILHDCLSMIEIYQRLYEVNKCLLKTRVRSTYVMLHAEKERLTAMIESFHVAHN